MGRIVAINSTIEIIHASSHARDTPSQECDVGIFQNRRGYYSPLKRLTAVDNYEKLVLGVYCPSGLISFEAEAIAMKSSYRHEYPHITMIDGLTATNSWSTVLGNKRLLIGSDSAATKLFISLGIRLKVSLNKGTIAVNPHGKV